jgi:hypothetical protein
MLREERPPSQDSDLPEDHSSAEEVFRISFRSLIGKQLKLEAEPLEKNCEFLEALTHLEIGTSHFDTLAYPESGRQPNLDMTSPRFAEAMNSRSLVDLALGDWYLQRYLFGEIRFVVRGTYLPEAPGDEQFFWFHAELNEENFQAVNAVFEGIYGVDLVTWAKRNSE